ncbi:recombinase family protein [Halioglobus maricola]|uniref:Recombinase family protein n=1 Tax=Halioglobus maricola TaxID=2601894 RepID=A0A5P9NHQ3_9GAMM|nr:recombinase family protein [Halioglobus maricola]QFU75350.1 recombinase family protein [Halioglobus maricola]
MGTGVKVGYARVSTTGQSLEVQMEALQAAGCDPENIFSEKQSGTTADRPKLKELQRFVRKGDTVYITKLDRLGRSLNDLSNIVEDFRSSGVGFVVLDQGIDTTTSTGRAMFGMLAVFAQFETDLRYERQMAGIEAAKAKGVQFGRKQSLETEAVVGAYMEHSSIGATAKALESTKTTVHRILKKAGVDTSGQTGAQKVPTKGSRKK